MDIDFYTFVTQVIIIADKLLTDFNKSSIINSEGFIDRRNNLYRINARKVKIKLNCATTFTVITNNLAK
ncbi:MAG TPA: hypothetical protein DD638_06820 [Pasteurellaceae bacterium]|nr:hypothetical protein [Pasteurellaceae bacterium]